jgi:hypothetical protein
MVMASYQSLLFVLGGLIGKRKSSGLWRGRGGLCVHTSMDGLRFVVAFFGLFLAYTLGVRLPFEMAGTETHLIYSGILGGIY